MLHFFFFFFFYKRDKAFCVAQAGPEPLGSSDPSISASGAVGTKNMCHYASLMLNFFFFFFAGEWWKWELNPEPCKW
jgi:hypothetical protein